MKIHFQHAKLKIQKQIVPSLQNIKVQTLTNQENLEHQFIYTNRLGDFYPEKTDKHCWWCRHPFETRPLGIPVYKESRDSKMFYEMEGIFCSFECCLSFLKDHSKSSLILSYDVSKKMLYELYRECGHHDMIKEAPDWKLLDKVGTGSISIEQFRSNLIHFIRNPDTYCVPHIVKYTITKK